MRASPVKRLGWTVVRFGSVTVTAGWEKSNPLKRLESIGFDG